MKKEYINAELEIVWISFDDIVKASGQTIDPKYDLFQTKDIDLPFVRG